MENTTSGGNVKTLLLAGGCFWCVIADLEDIPGVSQVVAGYAGGTTEFPTYNDYHVGGHREVVEVAYDPSAVSFEDILIVALKTMDPTDEGGSFADRGAGYAPAFYYSNEAEKSIIARLLNEVEQEGPYQSSLAIKVLPRPVFWPAENYHQDYHKGARSVDQYKKYRNASGRDEFIREHWGKDISSRLPWRS